MIGDFERYHGAVVRDIVVSAKRPIRLEACDDLGRVNAFLLDERFGLYLKHSSKRLPPWQFTYHDEHIDEIDRLASRCEAVWLVHICGQDGFVALSLNEFRSINPCDVGTTCFVRIDRDRNTMYRVNGTGAKLGKAMRRGLACVIEKLDC